MGGPQLRQRRSAVTVAALTALLLGSWLVVGSAAGSVTGPGPGTAATAHRSAGGPDRSTPATAPGGTDPSTAPGGTDPSTEPGGTDPSTSLSPSTTSPAPTTTTDTSTTTPVPMTTVGPDPFAAAAPIVTVGVRARPARARGSRARHAGAAMTGSSAQASRAAAQLIGAINLQSGLRGAIPDTADNIGLLGRWMANEGGLWADNPLNTSLDSGSYPHQFTASGQDTGIPIFPDLAAGLAATATTLLSNPSYSRILSVLRSGSASCIAFARVVIQSPWASGHYDHDPAGFCSGTIVPVGRGHQRHRGG